MGGVKISVEVDLCELLEKEYVTRCYKHSACYVDVVAHMRKLSKYYPIDVESVLHDVLNNCKFNGLEFVVEPNGVIYLVDARIAQLVRDAIEYNLRFDSIIHPLSTTLSKLPLKKQ